MGSLGRVFVVVLNAIGQVWIFPAAPLWAFIVIILDVVIIYNLTARWTGTTAYYHSVPRGAAAIQLKGEPAASSTPPLAFSDLGGVRQESVPVSREDKAPPLHETWWSNWGQPAAYLRAASSVLSQR